MIYDTTSRAYATEATYDTRRYQYGPPLDAGIKGWQFRNWRDAFIARLQHDGAPPHIGKFAEVLIDEFGATLDPPVKILRQPAQSPDTNILDLSFFRALASSVSKRRRGNELRLVQFDLQRLADDVQAAYKAYSHDTIEKMWAYKTVIMQKIIDAKGGNLYDRRRPKEEE